MKAKDLRELSVEALRAKETEVRQKLFAMRMQKAMGSLESPADYRNLKKDLARILTVIREKEIERNGGQK